MSDIRVLSPAPRALIKTKASIEPTKVRLITWDNFQFRAVMRFPGAQMAQNRNAALP